MSELLRTAIVGTGQTPAGSEDAPDEETARLVERLGAPDRERAILLRAGGEALLRRAAGLHPEARPIGEPAGPERLRRGSDRLADLIRRVVEESRPDLLIEAMGEMARVGLRLPEELLPTLLSRNDNQLRAALRPVLGERGRWLARQRSEWGWALATSALDASDEGAEEAAPFDAADVEARFAEGTAAERRALLSRARRRDPALARRLVSGAWKQEKAEGRLAILELMAPTLHADDEPLLEGLLGDRSATVRSAVAQLAWRLPESAIARRMRERLDVLVTWKAPAGGVLARLRGLVGAAPIGTLEVYLPPESWDPAWLRDGLVEEAPAGMGRRQWWLAQLLGAVSPAHLVEQAAITPAQLVTAAAAHELRDALLDGLTTGALRHRCQELYAPLWDAHLVRAVDESPDPHLTHEPLEALTPHLAAADLVPRMVDLVEREQQLKLLHLVPRPWPTPLSQAVLARLSAVSGAWTWLLPAAALGIAPADLPASVPVPPGPEPPEGQGVDYATRAALRQLDQFQSIAQLRRALHQEIHS